MIKNKVIFSLFFIFSMFFFSLKVMAGGFAIHSIGGVSTNNRQLSTFWHTSLAPTIVGVAVPGATITVAAGSETSQVMADSSGDWSYVASLGSGSHTISFTSNESIISMNLTLGSENVDWGKAAIGGNEKTLPSVGTIWPTFLILGLGISTIALGKKYLLK